MKTSMELARELNVTPQTLGRYVKLLNITPHVDPFDRRIKAFDEEQVEVLRRAMQRVFDRKRK